MPEFYEFFAGGGMARAGLGPGWTCRFANDFDPRKASAYRRNFGDDGLQIGDVRAVATADLPGVADLAWASFPCQDLSLAGGRGGLEAERSGSFYPLWRVMNALAAEGREPRIVALENVCGTLTSRGGADFQAICRTFAEAGYRCGALVIDAALFLPQSRPRLFVVGVRADLVLDPARLCAGPVAPFHPGALTRAVEAAPPAVRDGFLWWRLPEPPRRTATLADLIEPEPQGVAWRTPQETERLLSLMAPLHRAKVEAARSSGRRLVGAVYRRTRPDGTGGRAQRAEVRFDGLAGCLRTPGGGSSRQTILVVEGPQVRSRLLSARETARLMGLPDDYRLPRNYGEACHLTGDGVVVDVVRHLARELLEPLLGLSAATRAAA